MTGQLHDADYLRRLDQHLAARRPVDADRSIAVLTAAVSTLSAWLIFVATVLVLAAELSSTRLLLLAVWALVSICTVLRPGTGHRGPGRSRLLLVAWAVATATAIASFVGTELLVPFVGVVGLLGGVRFASNDASHGIERPPGYYFRRGLSPRGLAILAVVVGGIALNAMLWASILGPLLTSGQPILRWPEGMQTLQLVGALVVFTPIVLAVCELIAAVGRRETRVVGQLSDALRTKERDRVAQELHDRALSLLSAARLYPPDHPGHDRALDQLEMNLRSMQFEYELDAGNLTLDRCCRRSRALADLGGLDLDVTSTDAVLARPLDRPVALLIDQILHNLVANSVGAEASQAAVDLSVIDGHRLVGSFADDAGGFDPVVALQRGGGLSRLRQALDLMGGSLTIRPEGAAIDFELPAAVTEIRR